jgi:ribonuclease HI
MAAFYVLNTDASIGPSGKAAIGVVLRQKLRRGSPLTVIAFISKRVDADDIGEAEYIALIEGLRLAVPYEPTTLRVFTDSDSIPEQINDPNPKFKTPAIRRLYNRAQRQLNLIGRERVKVLWVPRDMNSEADQRAADAFFERRGDVWFRPTSA